MKLSSSCFADQHRIPGENSFCIPDGKGQCVLGGNRNPDLAWSDLPTGTRSLVLICHDPDVPSRPDDVNKEGRTVPASLPRVDFYHWVLVDLDWNSGPIQEGEFSSGVTPKGKPGPDAPRGARQGINSYTDWFAGDKDMGGNYFGYDGPCPPWNDELRHRYIFTLHALDIPKCPVSGTFTGADVLKAMEGHVIDKAVLTGLYTLNPKVFI
ncbi:MAG TPA: YbhB/YbcL family Raf kinase inhibitor-like protein [Burkholderiales bacterium]